jgi:hypothetical protein
MDLKRFVYEVKAEVSLNKDEYLALIKLAKLHYDPTCRKAALCCGDVVGFSVAKENGFLAQMELFPTTPDCSVQLWSLDQFDTVQKILEYRSHLRDSRRLGDRQMLEICDRLAPHLNELQHRLFAELKDLYTY